MPDGGLIDPQVALILLRSLPGEARIAREIGGYDAGFIIQFYNGIEIRYSIGKWTLSANLDRRLQEEWKTWFVPSEEDEDG